jgi:hypothetical protein
MKGNSMRQFHQIGTVAVNILTYSALLLLAFLQILIVVIFVALWDEFNAQVFLLALVGDLSSILATGVFIWGVVVKRSTLVAVSSIIILVGWWMLMSHNHLFFMATGLLGFVLLWSGAKLKYPWIFLSGIVLMVSMLVLRFHI